MATCRREVGVDELRLSEDSFIQLYKYHIEHGEIPDLIYDQLGFAEDLDPANNVVRRDASGANRESYQRAKTLSHTYQRQLSNKQLLLQWLVQRMKSIKRKQRSC